MAERQGLAQPDAMASTSGQRDSAASHMIAGALAGIAEHVAMYPVDTIKTRMQALSHPGQRLHRSSVLAALRAVQRREGLSGLYRGVGAVFWGAGPAHALHFATYEAAKSALGGHRDGYQWLATAGAGSLAAVVSEGFMTPLDVVKQRLQVAHTPYLGIVDCATRILKEEGMGALFRSYRTTLFMVVPFTAAHFSVYEAAKKFLLDSEDAAAAGGEDGGFLGAVFSGGAESDEGGLAEHLVAGGLAGGVAAAVTNPLDVVKTRLQTEGVHSSGSSGSSRGGSGSAVLPALRNIVEAEGWSALWRGVRPRIMFNVPAAAVCWSTYEGAKAFLAEHEE